MAKSADAAESVIEIPAIQLETMTVVLEGQTPLIVHRFGERARKKIEEKQQRVARGAVEPRDPDAEFRDSLYVIDEEAEKYGFPAAGVKKALVTAGGRFTDEKMTVLRGILNVMGDLLEIEGSKPTMRQDQVRLAGGTSSIAYRPMFDPWMLRVPVVYNRAMIRREQVINLFQIAGFSIGLGDWRPEKNGTFGCFIVKEAVSG